MEAKQLTDIKLNCCGKQLSQFSSADLIINKYLQNGMMCGKLHVNPYRKKRYKII